MILPLDHDRMRCNRQRLEDGDAALRAALEALCDQADAALRVAPPAVTDKPHAPPSGDKHDYLSMAAYVWPNPDTPDGLPYVMRDGQVNPERQKYDEPRLKTMLSSTRTLALAHYFTGRRDYAEHAAAMVRRWFLDPATAMNPHLRYTQFVPGLAEGKPWGVIEWSAHLPQTLETIDLLAPPAWSAAEAQALDDWLAQLLDWLLTDPLAQGADAKENNHGVYFDRLVAALMLRLGRRDAARARLADVPNHRMLPQIEPDGSMPHELRRATSWSYTVFNLEGMLDLVALGRVAGLDLWDAETAHGQRLTQALRYWHQHTIAADGWPYPQRYPIDNARGIDLIRRAHALGGPALDEAPLLQRLDETQRQTWARDPRRLV